ncbi:MAG TPA: RNA polymerase sigma factor [Thermoanaerobaculia bacterium]|nr:RNA polymerase sigma factor [Thermoanaerobaculia bacterium]
MTVADPAVPFPAEIPDEEVVRRVIAGERELFELLVRRHNQRVYRSVRAVLRNPDEAEDAMQQAYVDAYRHLHQFEGRSAFSTWLTRIAIREAFARNRKTTPLTRAVDGDEMMSDFPEPGPDPEERAVTSDLLEHVEAEVAALPETYRSVLLLREVEGLSTEETAECLEISADVVKTRLHRARGMLRDALYRRAGAGLQSIFSFGNARCDRVVARVMEEIRAL